MAINLNFDQNYNVISPTLVLARRNGEKIGAIPYHDLVFKETLANGAELSFKVSRQFHSMRDDVWEELSDFKLVWVKEWNIYFEIYVGSIEESSITKNVTAKTLGEAELSQINLYNVEINTESDIDRGDYIPTIFYNEKTIKGSLLHRILEKAPHYSIGYVSEKLNKIQRTFEFNGTTIRDAFTEISKECECLFTFECFQNNEGQIVRTINAYDLDSYGEDLNVLISTDILAKNISHSCNTGAVKNCFRLEAGDDLMTATVKSCNPNGSNYLWHFSQEMLNDMPKELAEKIIQYNKLYTYYQDTFDPFVVKYGDSPESDRKNISFFLTKEYDVTKSYNDLIKKYNNENNNYKKILSPLKGYSEISELLYDCIDFYAYLNNGMMPSIKTETNNAETEIKKITNDSLNSVAVQKLSDSTSKNTVSNAVLLMVKSIINPKFQVKIGDENTNFDTSTFKWSGIIEITNMVNEEDTAEVSITDLSITDDLYTYITQKINYALSKSNTDTPTDIKEIFKLEEEAFSVELKKYSLQRLISFNDSCQSCLDILMQQGVSQGNEGLLYNQIYLPYYKKLGLIQSEIDVRTKELSIINGEYNNDGILIHSGVKSIIEEGLKGIRKNLNFDNYLGHDLWLQLLSYRRDGNYSNKNYVSDGLNNVELFKMANTFMDSAKKEIYKSANDQHTISANLKNLLLMPEFVPFISSFSVGNWIRGKVDDQIYKLRLESYEVDFNNPEDLTVTFTDIIFNGTPTSNLKGILDKAVSMATSYDAVAKQVEQNEKTAKEVQTWINYGIPISKTKIYNAVDNQDIIWDQHGILLKEFNPHTQKYLETQMKISNNGLYITNDNWKTAKAGIGHFKYFDPKESIEKDSYGVVADTLIGNLILGKSVGIYNKKNNICIDENGLVVTTSESEDNNEQPIFTIRKEISSGQENKYWDMLKIDTEGNLVIDGKSIYLSAGTEQSSLNDVLDNYYTKSDLQITENGVTSSVTSYLKNNYTTTNQLGTYIQQNPESIKIAWNNISKYISFENAGLNIYSSGGQDKKILMRLNNQGSVFYQDGEMVGKIGTNRFSSKPEAKGLVFDLESAASYMAWAVADAPNSGVYNTKLTYYPKELTIEEKNVVYPQGFHFDDSVYINDELKVKKVASFLSTTQFEKEATFNNTTEFNKASTFNSTIIYNGKLVIFDGATMLKMDDETTFDLTSSKRELKISGLDGEISLNSDVTLCPAKDSLLKFKGNALMYRNKIYDVKTTVAADESLKKNIENSSVDALDLINKIKISEFDWIDIDEHVKAGIIAQELKKVIPELVALNPEDGSLSIVMSDIIPYLIKAIQEISTYLPIAGDMKEE